MFGSSPFPYKISPVGQFSVQKKLFLLDQKAEFEETSDIPTARDCVLSELRERLEQRFF